MKVVLSDSNELALAGLRAILSVDKSIEIVGDARSKVELIEMLSLFDVDVVLVDFTANQFTIDIISEISESFPSINTLAITPEQSAQVLVDALRLGVTSYVKKDWSINEIIDAVKETANGNKFFCGTIVETIQEANLNVEDIDYDAFSCDSIIISKREQEIIVLISEGLTNTQIAEKLFLSTHTVNSHRKNIMAKLGVKNTAGIVMYAVKSNLISPNKFLFTASN